MESSILIGYLQKISDKVNLLKNRNNIIGQENLLIAFRGESKDYGKTKLMPSLFRNSEYVLKEKYLFELLGDYDVINDTKNRNIERAIEAQHYVSISRMLDITFSVLPALYFCCESESNKSMDGIIYIFAFPEHYSPHSKYIEDFYSEILEGKDIAYSKNFKVVSHSFYNERVKSQNGGFIFFQGREFSPINDIYYESFEINSADKEEILNELNFMFAVNESTIYPEKENRAKLAKIKFESGKYSIKELTVNSEINIFFDRIQYESEIYKNKDEFDKNNYLRILRKEKSDLLSYINEKINQDDTSKEEKEAKIQKWEKYVNKCFCMLEHN